MAKQSMTTTSNVSEIPWSVTTDATAFIPWNNPENIISFQTYELIDKVVACGVAQVVMLLGIPGNVLNIAVFARQGLRDRVTLILFCLALADLLGLLCYFSIKTACFIEPVDPIMAWNAQTVQYPQVLYVFFLAFDISTVFVLLISIDRCIAVSMPLKAGLILTYKRTLYIMIGISVVIVSVFVPLFWWDKVVWSPDPITNRLRARLVSTDFSIQNKMYLTVLTFIITVWRMSCLAGTIVSCSITVRALRAAKNVRADMSESKLSQSEVKITVMLLFVCAVMVVSQLPNVVVTFTEWFVPDFYMFKKYHNIFVACQRFLILFRCVNTASNFYLYVALSSKFRATLVELFMTRKRTLKSDNRMIKTETVIT